MIKKLLIALTLAFALFTSTSVSAAPPATLYSWSILTDSNGDDYAYIEITPNSDATAITFRPGQYGYNLYTSASLVNSYIEFDIDYTDNELVTSTFTYSYDFTDIVPDNTKTLGVDEIRFDFISSNSEYYGFYDYDHIYELKEVRAYVYIDPTTPDPDALIEQIFDDSYILEYEFGIAEQANIEFYIGDFEDEFYYLASRIEYLWNGTEYLNLYIPPSQYHTDSGNVPPSSLLDSQSYIQFYNEDTPIFRLYITEYLQDIRANWKLDGLINIDMRKIFADNGYDIDEIDFEETDHRHYWVLYIPQTFEAEPDGYLEYINDTAYYTINKDLNVVEFWNESVLWDSYLYYDVPVAPTQPFVSGQVFTGWYTQTGIRVDFTKTFDIPDAWLDSQGVLSLYANYRITTSIDIDQTDETPDNIFIPILEQLNMNNTVGYLIVFVAILGVIIVFTNRFNMGTMVQFILTIGLTIFWIYLGFLPILAAIIVIALELIIFISYINRGGI